MSNYNFHCLFEQSGTFKNVFKEFGHNAWDYDILNDYGQTDFQIDLFKEIETEYDNIVAGGGIRTIFTDMKPEKDFIISFFPCTYFTEQQEINFRLQMGGISQEINNNAGKFLQKHINWLFNAIEQREYYFKLFIKFCFICEQKGIATIIENPANPSKRSYLEIYSPYRPTFYENDRSNFGDNFKKPTMFISINFKMKEKVTMFFDKNYNPKKIRDIRGMSKRSEITNTYARNFYKRFIENYIEELEDERN